MSTFLLPLAVASMVAALAQEDQPDNRPEHMLAPQICSGEIGSDAAAMIEACTFLIDSGRLAPAQLARAVFGRGLGRDEAGQGPAAIADFSEAIRLGLLHPAAFTARGVARVRTGDVDGARMDLAEAIRLDPRFAPALAGRGLLALAQGQFQNAWNDYDEAMRLDPVRGHYAYGRGLAAVRLNRAEGTAEIEAALRRAPSARDYFARFGMTP